jgi:hypothetical protein
MRENVRKERTALARTISFVQFVRIVMSLYEVADPAQNVEAAWITPTEGKNGWRKRGGATYNGEIHPLSFWQVSYAIHA